MLSPDLLSLEVVIDDGTDDETNECVGGSARCDNTFVAAVEGCCCCCCGNGGTYLDCILIILMHCYLTD